MRQNYKKALVKEEGLTLMRGAYQREFILESIMNHQEFVLFRVLHLLDFKRKIKSIIIGALSKKLLKRKLLLSRHMQLQNNQN